VSCKLFVTGTVPLLSKKIPCGHPMNNVLKISILEFLLICAPALNKELYGLVAFGFGPITVKFVNTGAVIGVLADPVASLSDSKASDVEISAIFGSLKAIPNCTLPVNPLSVSKSSSCVL